MPPSPRGRRTPAKLPVYLTLEERERLLTAVKEFDLHRVPAGTQRSVAIVTLLLFSGLRVAELVALDDSDVDATTIYVRRGKGGKQRNIPLHPRAADAVAAYRATRPDLEPTLFHLGGPPLPLFVSRHSRRISVRTVQRSVSAIVKKAGITKPVTPHKLRHTFATLAMDRGGKLPYIQRLLGHTSLATTEIYIHVSDAELRAVVNRL